VLNTGLCKKPSLAVEERAPTFVGERGKAHGYWVLAVEEDGQLPGVIYNR